MKINRNTFTDAVSRCMLAVDAKSPEYDVVYITEDTISSASYTLRVCVPLKLPGEFDIAVKASDFYAILKKFKGDELDLSVSNDHLLITSGKAKAKIAVLGKTPAAVWPTILPGNFVNLPENFSQLLLKCQIPGNTSVISGIYVNGTDMYSTDRVKINAGKLDKEMPLFWVNDLAIKTLAKLPNNSSYCVRQGVVAFKDVDGTEVMVKPLNAEQYPVAVLEGYCQKVPIEGFFPLPEDLAGAIQRAAPLAEKEEGSFCIVLKFEETGVLVSTGRSSGEYEEFVDGHFPEHDAITLEYRHLMYGLGRGSEAALVGVPYDGGLLRILCIKSGDTVHIINAIR